MLNVTNKNKWHGFLRPSVLKKSEWIGMAMLFLFTAVGLVVPYVAVKLIVAAFSAAFIVTYRPPTRFG